MPKQKSKVIWVYVRNISALLFFIVVLSTFVFIVMMDRSEQHTAQQAEDGVAQLYTPGPQTYNEDFSTQNFYDINYTNADWNTAQGVVTLPSNRDTATASSLVIDQLSDNIKSAKLTSNDTTGAASISYFLSNDNGLTYESVTPGSKHDFMTTGSSLRWRAELTRGPAPGNESPVINSLTIVYESEPQDYVASINALDIDLLSMITSKSIFAQAGTAQAVLLSRNDTAVDSFIGVTLAERATAPILFTEKGSLDIDVADEIARVLGNKSKPIYLLGGPEALAPQIEDQLAQRAYTNVIRLGGSDRYETAKLITQKVASLNPAPAKKVFLTEGTKLVDAFAIANQVAKGNDNIVDGIAITNRGSGVLNANAKSVLQAGNVNEVVLVGGTTSLPSSLEQEIKNILSNATITRLNGATRFETNDAIAKKYHQQPGTAVIVDGYPEYAAQGTHVTLLGALLSTVYEAPLLFAAPTSLTDQATQYFSSKSSSLNKVIAVGDVGRGNQDVYTLIKNLISQ